MISVLRLRCGQALPDYPAAAADLGTANEAIKKEATDAGGEERIRCDAVTHCTLAHAIVPAYLRPCCAFRVYQASTCHAWRTPPLLLPLQAART